MMNRMNRTVLWGGVLLVLGLLFLLQNLGILPFGVGRLWPVILIILGLSLIYNFLRWREETGWDTSTGGGETSISSQGRFYSDKLLGEVKLDFDNQELKSGFIHTGVGDIKLDLSRAILPQGENLLRIGCWIGDIKLYLPKDAAVSASARALLGDVEVMGEKSSGFNCELEKASEGYNEAASRLRVEASLLIGDVKLFR